LSPRDKRFVHRSPNRAPPKFREPTHNAKQESYFFPTKNNTIWRNHPLDTWMSSNWDEKSNLCQPVLRENFSMLKNL